ncbi:MULTISPECIES: class IV adenylate cyclase [unclassified Nocardiopsis]|uniref:class IV adenylate cyclase n=1 Tax=unclassified Nocardiopsis TaxID=2649073 RepID=UPI00135CEC18|nr:MULTISPECIES: class IV adenylate cyclase [unclassified Nocardiopsis]
MILEVERKRSLGADTERVKDRLAQAGFREVDSSAEVDTYFSRPDVDYLETIECLRVRRRNGSAEITYKPPSTPTTHTLDGVTAKCETNVHLADVDQADNALALLHSVGMVELAQVDKSRTAWRHPQRQGVTVAVDTVAGVGAFVETEVMSTDSDRASHVLEEIESLLDLQSYPVVTVPYRDLVLQLE